MVDINPFWLGALGGFLNALLSYVKKNLINPPKDAVIDHNYEAKLLLVIGLSYAIAGGVLAALLSLKLKFPQTGQTPLTSICSSVSCLKSS